MRWDEEETQGGACTRVAVPFEASMSPRDHHNTPIDGLHACMRLDPEDARRVGVNNVAGNRHTDTNLLLFKNKVQDTPHKESRV